MPPLSVTGAVLAGGRSVRMGTDKAALTVAGEPLLARQLRLLAEAGVGERIVSVAPTSSRPALPGQEAVRWVEDSEAGLGPLAGLESCLAAIRTDVLLVVAVDLPALSVDLLRRLIAAATAECGVVPQCQACYEPLVAVYPRCALVEVSARIARSELALQPLVRAGIAGGWLRPWAVSTADEPCFANWNAPADVPADGFDRAFEH